MGKPVVLAAWEPEGPEEALPLQETLGPVAEVHWGHELSEPLRAQLLPTVDAVALFYWPDWLTRELPRMKRLRFIQRLYAGVDTLPLAELAKHRPRVIVAGASGSNAAPVAEHAWALALACAKRIRVQDAAVRRGEFLPWERNSVELDWHTLGVLGYGAIGQRVARIGKALGMEVLALRRHPPFKPPVIGDLRRLKRVLRESDVVVIALPHTRATHGLFNRERLGWMKNDAILVNISRAAIVDEDALFARLKAFPQFHAGLDVWWNAPPSGQKLSMRLPFHELDNVILTPHSASATSGMRVRAVEFGAKNVARFLRGGRPANVVDLADYMGRT